MDLDAWINDPPSESEDESVPNITRYEKSGLFSGENTVPEYQKVKNYVEPSVEELEKQRESRKQSEQLNPFYLKDAKKSKSIQEIPSTTLTNGNEHVQSKETVSSHLQLSLSDQFYRQSKIDEENRRLKKKSKSDGGSTKKGKKSSKKSDLAAIDDNDEDIYPTVQVTRGGELPEGVTESGNEDNEEELSGKKKKKKIDPHRALNIDLNEKPTQPIPPPPPPPPPKEVTPSPPVSEEKPKKSKKKKTTETNEQTKPKKKRERGDYKELSSPLDDEEKHQTPVPPPPIIEKPKKKKTKDKNPPPTVETNNSAPLLLDIMSDDINPINQSDEQHVFKPAAQSDNLIIVSAGISHYLVF